MKGQSPNWIGHRASISVDAGSNPAWPSKIGRRFMMEFSFCESVTASSISPWHLRKLTKVGRKLGGGIDTPSLCERVKQGWDLEVEITEFHLEKNTCRDCLRAYRGVV